MKSENSNRPRPPPRRPRILAENAEDAIDDEINDEINDEIDDEDEDEIEDEDEDEREAGLCNVGMDQALLKREMDDER